MNPSSTALPPQTRRFLKRFPTCSQINTNCTVDLACGECGSRGPFYVSVSGIASLDDSGTEGPSSTEHTDASFCSCQECDHEGTVQTFTLPGLDEALAARQA